MNKFKLSTMIAILLVISTIGAFAHDKNYEPLPKQFGISSLSCAIQPAPFDINKIYGKYSKNKLQEANFVVFDSLANSLSYHSRSTTPFVWDPDFDMLVTVKRGSHNPSEVGVNENNTKDNLFLRLSSDKGITWETNQILVYNQLLDQRGGARYPSLATFSLAGEITMAYTCSLVNETAGTWHGYITGIYGQTAGSANDYSPFCVVGANSFDWGISDAAIYAKETGGGSFYVLGANNLVTFPTTTTVIDNGDIGLRKIVDLASTTTSIPAAWAKGKFYPQTSTNGGVMRDIGFRTRKDGTLYLGTDARFIGNQNVDSYTVGFSTSNDGGETWSDFIYMPDALFYDYATAHGVEKPDSMFSRGASKDFTVLANGDVYFVGYLAEYNENKATQDKIHQIILMKYEASSGNWSISKVQNVTGYWMDLKDDTGASAGSNDFEIEIAKTVDEKILLVKYIDLTGVDNVANTFLSSDIYVTTHKVGANGWSDTLNITNDYILDRDTHIPEIIQNSLSGLPILKLHSVITEDEAPGTSGYMAAAIQYLRHQWVLCGHFDALVGVEEDNQIVSGIKINRIFPNPSTGNSNIEFTTIGNGNCEINVTDLLGNVVMVVYNGLIEEGSHSFNFNTNGLMNGAYYVTLKSGNKTATELVNVVK